MGICAIICEFNPFHNGHEYLIGRARELTGCEYILCVMSGSFTQRGESCLLDKFTRAEHAIKGGADAVIELPVCFSAAPAEIFARGAVKLISSIPSVTHLAFGTESLCDLNKAAAVDTYSRKFRDLLKEGLDAGESYVKSYGRAFAACGGDVSAISSPNNILATEYIRALNECRSEITPVPVLRRGAGYSDTELGGDFASARAIRTHVGDRKIADHVPPYVFADLPTEKSDGSVLDGILRYALLSEDKKDLVRIYGCGEGLENRLQELWDRPTEEIIKTATGRRYTSARIRRILISCALGLYSDRCAEFLRSELYLKLLAVNSRIKDRLLGILKEGYPLVIRGRDRLKLNGTAAECLSLDDRAQRLWDIVNGKRTYNDRLIKADRD